LNALGLQKRQIQTNAAAGTFDAAKKLDTGQELRRNEVLVTGSSQSVINTQLSARCSADRGRARVLAANSVGITARQGWKNLRLVGPLTSSIAKGDLA